MECEFEEKEYEGPLNNELLLGDPRIWSPGQVFEKYMGIDSALFVGSQLFWEFLEKPIGVNSPQFTKLESI